MATSRRNARRITYAALLMLLVLAPPSDAGMEVAYFQDFENGRDGWILEPYTRSDEIDIIPEPYFDPGPNPAARDAHNRVLSACALDPRRGCGFWAESPTFDTMGVDTTLPYEIQFRYGMHLTPACWTYTLASTHVSLVITECHRDLGYAVLAFVDEVANTVREVGRIAINPEPESSIFWNDIHVRVEPDVRGPGADVTIGLNGVNAGTFRRSYERAYDKLVFVDLPYLTVDAADMDGIPTITAYGSGVWDDVTVRREVLEGGRPRGIHPTVTPNPLNPHTEISFVLDREATVRVELFDVRGRRVRALFEGRLPAGPQSLRWDGRDDARHGVASGPYLVRTTVDGETTVTRAMVVR